MIVVGALSYKVPASVRRVGQIRPLFHKKSKTPGGLSLDDLNKELQKSCGMSSASVLSVLRHRQ